MLNFQKTQFFTKLQFLNTTIVNIIFNFFQNSNKVKIVLQEKNF